MIHLTKIIAAILVLLAISLGGYAWMLSRQPARTPAATVPAAAAAPQERLYPVVVTRKAVPAGQALTADMLRVAQLPLNPPGAFTDTATPAGRVTIMDMGEGTPLLQNQLVSGLALRLAEGERAVAVKADEVMGVGNRVQPGDFVDVFVSLKSDSREIERSQTRLLLSRKRVLAFGSASVDGAPKSADGKQASQGSAQQRAEAARTVVLAVPVEEVNRLSVGESGGRLLLALRHPNDMSLPDPKLFAEPPTALQPLASASRPRGTPLSAIDLAQGGLAVDDLANGAGGAAVRRAGLVSNSAAARPASLPRAPGGLEVEVIRGDRRETVRY
ncbi:MAG: Flp pilus assembly protein CpaB [Comamonadaceae bacterium]|nr:MAG: Flp pilus assembly protein CpaB [Comamonadaceae bacterium]